MISSSSIWYIILLLRLKKQNFGNKYSKELSELSLLKKSNAAISFSLSLTLFSIAGIPPLVGFFAKMSVFLSIVGISFYLVALATILCSVVSTFCALEKDVKEGCLLARHLGRISCFNC